MASPRCPRRQAVDSTPGWSPWTSCSPRVGPDAADHIEDQRREHVASGDRQIARRILGLGLFDQIDHAESVAAFRLGLHDAVMAGLLAWNLLHGDLGYSFYNSTSVRSLMWERVPVTFSLAIGAAWRTV